MMTLRDDRPCLTSRVGLTAHNEAGRDVDDKDEREEDESRCPGLPMPVFVGSDGIFKNGVRQRSRRLVPARTPKQVAEGCE